MISNSVSNKNWIFKEYDEQDVLFFKENYSLDEITSKLLSIRKIKKENVQTFLTPSIRNFLPNPKIINDMEKSTIRTLQAISKKIKLVYLEIMMLMVLQQRHYLLTILVISTCLLKFIFQIEKKRVMDHL